MNETVAPGFHALRDMRMMTENNIRARLGKADGDRLAQSPCAAGDQRNLSVDSKRV